jgi:predicted ATP-dependent protease
MPLPPLTSDQLYRRCDPAELPFDTTAALEPSTEPLGQDRAVAAVRFAIGMRSAGYNLYALGPVGTGKLSLIRRFLEQAADGQPVPDDWCYVNNFVEPHRPRALRLPAGKAQAFRKEMEHLVEELAAALPAAFDGEEYRSRRQVIEEQWKERHEAAFSEVQKRAADRGIALIRTPVGLALAPVREGEVLSPDEFAKLPEEEQKRLKSDMGELQEELEHNLKSLPQWERQQREQIRALDREVAAWVVGHVMEELIHRYEALPQVKDYLEAVQADVVDNAEDFIKPAEGDEKHPFRARLMKTDSGPFRRYKVNVIVDQDGAHGAPVIYEDHPTQPNLVGRVEYISQFGALVTDFNLIKAGALHRANGGYLILDSRKLLTQPFAYEELKRTLRAHEIRIESPYQSLGLMSTLSLEPEPIPMNLKIVLVGEPMLYYLLSHHDPEFPVLFKVSADFDYRMARDDSTILGIARRVAAVVRDESLRPFGRDAVARLIEHGSRLAGDSEKLTTHLASIVDLVREADYFAGQTEAEVVAAAHVQAAIDDQVYRSDRVREHIQEEIERGTLLIDTRGAVAGQINALAVWQLGRFSFGRPSRITCRVRMGKGEVVDIEREVDLGGPTHSKGVLILSAYLLSRFGLDSHLSLSASLVFEQSYGGIDGDSASSTELYVLLSALAEVPIRQDLAVTGSVNQFGQVQAIGGVNEKIEGFFDVCRARGLTGQQGVLIPAANVRHLMLRPDVVEACAAGQFAIYPVETIEQGIELLTGLPAGAADDKGEYPSGSVFRKVASRLASFARKAKQQSGDEGKNGK